jgi:drug/metabolite transporter (DMT)-like permease
VSPRLSAILQACFVVFLWATSWVFIKIGLEDIPPLTFAGLRYALAFLCLAAVTAATGRLESLRKLSWKDWGRLATLGGVFYAATQGASFVALDFLPAVTVNLIWSFTSLVVALLGIFWLGENPGRLQWLGMGIAVGGACVYFLPVDIPAAQSAGVLAALVGLTANAVAAIMGRGVNRESRTSPLVVTVVSMGVGSLLLMGAGISLEGLPSLSARSWRIILWLAIVNTAFAFTLWNHTLRTLTAMESSIINGTMMIWIPILAVIFLGETITAKGILGLVAAGLGTLLVQLHRPARIFRRLLDWAAGGRTSTR